MSIPSRASTAISSTNGDSDFDDDLASLDPHKAEPADKTDDQSTRPATSPSETSSISSKRALGLQRYPTFYVFVARLCSMCAHFFQCKHWCAVPMLAPVDQLASVLGTPWAKRVSGYGAHKSTPNLPEVKRRHPSAASA